MLGLALTKYVIPLITHCIVHTMYSYDIHVHCSGSTAQYSCLDLENHFYNANEETPVGTAIYNFTLDKQYVRTEFVFIEPINDPLEFNRNSGYLQLIEDDNIDYVNFTVTTEKLLDLNSLNPNNVDVRSNLLIKIYNCRKG